MNLHVHVHTPIGFCSNGEYNSLRNQGYTRPLSILRIRSDVRSKYAKMSKQVMTAMLTPEGEYMYIYQLINQHQHHYKCTHTPSNAHKVKAGQVVAKRAHPGVSGDLLTEVLNWKKQELDWKDILNRLRPQTVPPGYIHGRQV